MMTLDTTARHRLEPQAHPQAPRKTVLSRLSDALLSVLSFAGVLCIIAVVCAFALNITLIMFKTGSMSPTIPTGSLAIVQDKSAADVRVGEVITVDRPSQLPVTHRVTSIEPTTAGHYSIRMKGDANDAEDSQSYEVREVRKVLWSAPGLGYIVAKAQNPKVMAVTTLGMAVLVTWAFWPRKARTS